MLGKDGEYDPQSTRPANLHRGALGYVGIYQQARRPQDPPAMGGAQGGKRHGVHSLS